MDPIEVLSTLSHLEGPKTNICTDQSISACAHVFSRHSLDGNVRTLLSPTTGDASADTPDIAYRSDHGPKDPVISSDVYMPFDSSALVSAYPSINVPIQPSNVPLRFLSESFRLLSVSLSRLPGFKLDGNLSSFDPMVIDASSYFTQLVDSFFGYLDQMVVPKLCTDNDDPGSQEVIQNCAKDYPNGYDRNLYRWLLQCHVLWYNWVLQMRYHTNVAMGFAKSVPGESDSQRVLTTALGLKESNRNMVLYSRLCVQLRELLHNSELSLNRVIWELLSRMHILGHVGGDQRDGSKSWSRISDLLSDDLRAEHVTGNDEELFRHNLKRMRYEMDARIKNKGQCDALAKECDYLAQEHSALTGRKLTLASKLEQITKVLKELISSYKTEIQVDILKIPDAKKLAPLLYHLGSRIQLYSLSNPNREIFIKVIKDREYSLRMSLSAPRDTVIPNNDAASKCFPLNFRIYLDDTGHLRVNKPNYSFNIMPIGTCTVTPGQSTESIPDNMGLDEFSTGDYELPIAFRQSIDYWYDTAIYYIWNNYLIECYRRNRLEITSLLPPELSLARASCYEYKDSILLLSNSCASVKVRLQIDADQRPSCSFDSFECHGRLSINRHVPLIDKVSPKFNPVTHDNVCKVRYDVQHHICAVTGIYWPRHSIALWI
eukprot:XP_001609477.1 hypothetical protein [Babesia bovis T2Bo]